MTSTAVARSWHDLSADLTTSSRIGAIGLSWRSSPAAAYEVHAVRGVDRDWQPGTGSLLSVVTVPRFVHRGLGPRSEAWTYRVVSYGHDGQRACSAAVTAHSLTSVAVDGRPIAVVGEFDGRGTELALAESGFVHYRTRFPHDVDFRAGFDLPGERWSFVHPGPEDAWAGRRPHHFRLRFDLAERPRRAVELAVWVADRHPSRAGTMDLRINDVDLDPLLFDATTGEAHSTLAMPGAGAGPARFERTVPASALRTGENVLTLGKSQGSWVVYDAVGLFERG